MKRIAIISIEDEPEVRQAIIRDLEPYTKSFRIEGAEDVEDARDLIASIKDEGDWVGWVGTYEDLVEGNDGQYHIRLKDNKNRWDCAYPGVEILPDDTIVTTTYGHWDEGEQPYILCVRLKLSELDELKKK